MTTDTDPMLWLEMVLWSSEVALTDSRCWKRLYYYPGIIKELAKHQTTHLRVWLLIFHMKKKFPMGNTTSHRTCGPCKWLHWPGGPGREESSLSCSQKLSVPRAHVDQDSQRQQLWRGTGPSRVPQGISEPSPVAPQASSTTCWALTRSTSFISL